MGGNHCLNCTFAIKWSLNLQRKLKKKQKKKHFKQASSDPNKRQDVITEWVIFTVKHPIASILKHILHKYNHNKILLSPICLVEHK